MKNKLIGILFSLALSSAVFAHGDHGEHAETIYSQMGVPIQIKQAKEFSRYVIFRFIQSGRLEKSWSESKLVEAKTQTINEEKEWVVSYNNPKEKDNKKKTIYIFLDEFGNPFSINFTGELN